jgi:hypothetical protein
LRSLYCTHGHSRACTFSGMLTAFLCNCPCFAADLYVSTREALHWMFASGLAKRGTLIGYDDWWASPCSRGGHHVHALETGEGRAHVEIATEFKVHFQCISGSCDPNLCSGMVWGPVFRVESVGVRVSHGFVFTRTHERDWMRHSILCAKKRNRTDHGIIRHLVRHRRRGGEGHGQG